MSGDSPDDTQHTSLERMTQLEDDAMEITESWKDMNNTKLLSEKMTIIPNMNEDSLK